MVQARVSNTISWLLLVMMAVIVSSAVVYASSSYEDWDEGDIGGLAREDMEWLANIMGELSDRSIGVTATNMGIWELTRGRTLGEIASDLLEHVSGMTYRTHEHNVVGSTRLSDATILSMSVQYYTEDQVLVVATIQSDELEELSSYEGWFRSIRHLWAERGITTDGWRINMQAVMKQGRESEELWDVLQLSGAVRMSSDAGYQDERTESRTFHVQQLHGSVLMGELGEVNLQAAWHRSTTDGSYRVTLGTPLITIEY